MPSRLATLLLSCTPVRSFYLPGVSPTEYPDGSKVDLKVNKLTSTTTQLPYEWYSLPFCAPEEIVYMGENLGEVMRGDRILNSMYNIKMNIEESCKILCRKDYAKAQMKEFATKVPHSARGRSRASSRLCRASHRTLSASTRCLLVPALQIQEDYRVNWIVDNLPAATRVVR